MITSKLIFETHDGLIATTEVLCRLATRGFDDGPFNYDYLRRTPLGAVRFLHEKGFDARIEDADTADRAITVTARGGAEVQLKWVERDGEEGYEVVKITDGRY